LSGRPVELFEQLPAGHPEPADWPLLVEPPEQLADCRVQLGEAVEPAIAQTTDEPTLDNQDAGFHLRLGERRQLQVIRARSGARYASHIRFIRIAVASST
jgi:hypothetical protein